MKELKNTLIKYLDCLEKEELIRFRSFLSDANFQSNTKNEKRKRLIRLLELIERYVLKKYKYTLAIQAKIYCELYADNEERVGRINTKQKNKLAANMTELTKLVERFLMYEALEKDEACQTKLLGNKLLDKKQFDLWKRFERKFYRQLEDEETDSYPAVVKKIQFETLRLKYLEQTGEVFEKDNLSVLTTLINQHWLIKNYELQSSIISLAKLNPNKDYSTIPPLDAYFTLSGFYKKSGTALEKYTQRLHLNDISLKLQIQPSNELYKKLLEQIMINKENLTQWELTDFFLKANNFCILKIRKGDSIYSNELLKNYKTMETLGVLTKSENIQFNTLLNIVKLSCDNKDFNWAEKMINKYASFINPKEQASAKDLLYCAFYFYCGNNASNQRDKKINYEKANKHIESVVKKNIPLQLNYRILQAKLSFEMDEQYNPYTIPNFKYTIVAIQKLKGLNQNHKKFSLNFLRILMMLYIYKHKHSNIKMDEIKAKMAKMKAKNSGISNEQWLLEKMGELKKI